ncbi:MAG TPA: hypothetical protein VFQ23_20665 [Anaerolineales bacterium]|nr:hypothetical protein [Anaerolineales bacterium]
MALLCQIMGKPDLQLTFQSVGGIPNVPWQSGLSTPMKQAQNISFGFYGEALLE